MQKILIFLGILSAVQMSAQPSNRHFSHTVTTTARPETIWDIWTDVPNWHQWDTGLKAATLNGTFAPGARGRLIPDKGPTSKFVITEVQSPASYVFYTKLPLGKLYVKRSWQVNNGVTEFTHEVWFKGVSKGLFGRVLGKKYRAILPDVMQKIKTLAETSQ
jgi:hypothetical protein